MKIAALAGGVGGAKLVHGLAQILSPQELTVIVNTGDDFEHLGLYICPDLDTVCYTLAGLANPDTGWGRSQETWQAMLNLERLGGPNWFRLGDQDLATHLERTRRLKEGQPLSQVVREFCARWDVRHPVLPMSDQAVRTLVETAEGELIFQEYFVHRRCEPRVTGFEFQGADQAQPAPGVLESIQSAEAIVICPSNPWVSIGPILAISGLRQAVRTRKVVAVSPIIGGQAIKGPAAKMFQELGIGPSALEVAKHYEDFLTGLVLDQIDAQLEAGIRRLNIRTRTTQTLMRTTSDRRQLAEDVLDFIRTLS